jgi:hypothetical protein
VLSPPPTCGMLTGARMKKAGRERDRLSDAAGFEA